MEGPNAGDIVTPGIRLVKRLRMGGMGSLWLAQHDKLATEVVVKFLSSGLCEETANRTRFLNEAAAAAQVRSPHVVHMMDHGVTADGTPFIVMEYLEGEDLGRVLRDGPLAPERVASVVEQVARALDAAHRRGVIHRDVKPGNIFLTDVGAREPFVKLLDFGIAKAATLEDLTTTGELIGTPLYMSPEQIEGRPFDHRTDLWSLAVVAFRAMTGRRPFNADTVSSMAYQVVHTPAPNPTELRSDLPPAVDGWFARATAKDPAHRFASARQLADELWCAIGRPDAASQTAASSSGAFGALSSPGTLDSGAALPLVAQNSASASGPGLVPSSGRPSWPTPPAQSLRSSTLEEADTAVASGATARTRVPAMEATGGSLQSSVSAVGHARRGRGRHTLTLVALLGAFAFVVAGGAIWGWTTYDGDPRSGPASSSPGTVGQPSPGGEARPAATGTSGRSASQDEHGQTTAPTAEPEDRDGGASATSEPDASSAPPRAKPPAVPRRAPASRDGEIEDLGF